jgi:hypothetical protein
MVSFAKEQHQQCFAEDTVCAIGAEKFGWLMGLYERPGPCGSFGYQRR